eukprot:gene20710-24873_t
MRHCPHIPAGRGEIFHAALKTRPYRRLAPPFFLATVVVLPAVRTPWHGSGSHRFSSDWNVKYGRARRDDTGRRQAGPARKGVMMSPLMLPSAQLRGDRIARLNLVAAAAMLAAASLLLVLFQWFSLQASLQRTLQIQAGMLAPAATLALRQDNLLAAEQTLAALAAAPHIEQALLYQPGGQPFARYARSAAGAAPTAPHAGMQVDFLTGNATFVQSLPGGGALLLRTSLAQQYRSLAHFAAFTLLLTALLLERRDWSTRTILPV